jgi:hypothetical protein
MQDHTASLIAYRVTVDLDVKPSTRGGILFNCWGYQPGDMLPQCTALTMQQRHWHDNMAPAATKLGGGAVLIMHASG